MSEAELIIRQNNVRTYIARYKRLVADSKKLKTLPSNQEQKYLDEIVAVFYRPRKWFWFIRKAFTDNQDPRKRFVNRTLKKRCRRIARMDYEIKYSVFLFFSGVLNSLPVLYPYVIISKKKMPAAKIMVGHR
jgi:hypothetical protein